MKEKYYLSVTKHYLAFYLNHKLLDDDVRYIRLHTYTRRPYCSGDLL